MSAKQPPVQVPATKTFSKDLHEFTDSWKQWFSGIFPIWQRTQNYNVYDYIVPADGSTYTAPPAVDSVLLEPAGALAALTVLLPALPQDRDTFSVSSTHDITALTVGGAYTVLNAPAGLLAGQGVCWQFRLANTTWYRRS